MSEKPSVELYVEGTTHTIVCCNVSAWDMSTKAGLNKYRVLTGDLVSWSLEFKADLAEDVEAQTLFGRFYELYFNALSVVEAVEDPRPLVDVSLGGFGSTPSYPYTAKASNSAGRRYLASWYALTHKSNARHYNLTDGVVYAMCSHAAQNLMLDISYVFEHS